MAEINFLVNSHFTQLPGMLKIEQYRMKGLVYVVYNYSLWHKPHRESGATIFEHMFIPGSRVASVMGMGQVSTDEQQGH